MAGVCMTGKQKSVASTNWLTTVMRENQNR